MLAVVTVSNIQIAGDTNLQADIAAQGSWGNSLTDQVQWNVISALGGAAAAVRAKVLAWAASQSVTLLPSQVIVIGVPDDQISGARLSADAAFAVTSFADVPDLSFQLAPNTTYLFEWTGAYISAAAQTALQLSVNGPVSPTFMRCVAEIYTSATTPFAYGIGAYDNAQNPGTSGGSTALPFRVKGSITTGAAGGPLALRARSEVNASAVTLLKGSIGELVQSSN